MKVTVTHINIPHYSTIGFGTGTNDNGETVHFVGDHRPMRELGEAINATHDFNETEEWADHRYVVDLEPWQILAVVSA